MGLAFPKFDFVSYTHSDNTIRIVKHNDLAINGGLPIIILIIIYYIKIKIRSPPIPVVAPEILCYRIGSRHVYIAKAMFQLPNLFYMHTFCYTK